MKKEGRIKKMNMKNAKSNNKEETKENTTIIMEKENRMKSKMKEIHT